MLFIILALLIVNLCISISSLRSVDSVIDLELDIERQFRRFERKLNFSTWGKKCGKK